MFLNEVLAQLVTAELSQLNYGSDAGIQDTDNLRKLSLIVQAGIHDLNKRFGIHENELLLRTEVGQNIYELIPSNALSHKVDGFIIDTPENPFKGDIMSIFRITAPNGTSVWLNTDVPYHTTSENIFGRSPSIFTYEGINMLSYNKIKLPSDHLGGDYLIHYKAKIPDMDLSLNAEDTYIDMPDHFMHALVLYVASRIYNPMGSETIGRGMFHEGNNYWSKYLEELEALRSNIGSISSSGETTNFIRNGWV